MSNKSGQVISLPRGGGALQGIGEKFSPDLHTGTGNFTVPLTLPSGRNGFQPELSLVYSTGNGNGPFGLGWSLSVPGVSRQTSRGVPLYDDEEDTFLLSGSEDLVPVERLPGKTRYRPRTEGLFARIHHHHDANDDYWDVLSKDGLLSRYGTPASAGRDPAAVADPANRTRVFGWRLSRTTDPFGNRIEYEYERDLGEDRFHLWDQSYLSRIRYADYELEGETRFLVSVSFEYEERPDPFSEHRAGFEVRTRKRCKRVEVRTHTGEDRSVRTYEMVYLDQRPGMVHLLPRNGVSLLSQVRVVGHDGDRWEELPPLEFGYGRFEPERRDFISLRGEDLPARSLGNPDTELVDLFGNGLPDILETNGTVRYWRNLGDGTYDRPREMRNAPAGLRLADPGVQLVDADGDGRTDLLVTANGLSGYYPLRFGGLWDSRSFQRFECAPSFNLEDPEVRLLDLDGDGVTDVLRSGRRFECFFTEVNGRRRGWTSEKTRFVERRAVEDFPDVSFSDPRVKWADMTGDGLQDIVLVHDGNVEYWPNLGRGEWGRRVSMRGSPRLPYGHDPGRVLVGDVDGDGAADVVYVDDGRVTLWINESGNGFGDPVEVRGTPSVTDTDAVRLADVLGSGVGGVLWSADADGSSSRKNMFFLDFTGGSKPYLLEEMDNHMGAVTRVGYAPSTRFYLEDEKRPETRWKTPLPFPVHVVSRVEVIGEISGSKLATEYRYHHGYWDGAEREFRGFGMVEHLDTEAFEDYNQSGLHGEGTAFVRVADQRRFSPPTLTKTWFHQGPIGDEAGEWDEADFATEFWQGDNQMFSRPPGLTDFLKQLPRRVKRDALRALRGRPLRTELYALDGNEREGRPYTVEEHLYGVCEVVEEDDGHKLICAPRPRDTLAITGDDAPPRVFFPHSRAQRTTQWERGNDPMTQFNFVDNHDEHGQPRRQTQVACPRGWRRPEDAPGKSYLATRTNTVYARPDDPLVHIADRVARTTKYDIGNDGTRGVFDLRDTPDDSPSLEVIGQTLNFYDGDAFEGLPFGRLGPYGALVRTENLVLTEEILHEAYKSGGAVKSPPERPPYLAPAGSPAWTAEYPQEFRERLPVLAGYTFRPGETEYHRGYFATAERRRYDFHGAAEGKGRGLVAAKRDPLGRDTTIVCDEPYHVLPKEVTDPLGLKTAADYDYRVLQPAEVTDPNGNRTRFTFTPLGLPLETWFLGGSPDDEGDRQRPSGKLEYDFHAFVGRGQPISVRTVRQVHHDTETDVVGPRRDETIATVEYSDGFGRLLQTRTQAEEIVFGDDAFGSGTLTADQTGPAGSAVGQPVADPALRPRVVVSGWQTYDNKGRVVEKYEPFFSEGWEYKAPSGAHLGQKITMFYDPRGQTVRTVNPDGSEQRVIHGVPVELGNPEDFAPTPWETYTYDANDGAGRTHPVASAGYQNHWNTPASGLVDALGRTVATVERNGPDPETERHVTRFTYDVRGNLLTVIDPLGRLAFRHVYDLGDRTLRTEQPDAGLQRTVVDAANNKVEQRDGKGALALRAFDAGNRQIRLWARDGTDQALTLRERLIYGDGADSGLTAARAAAENLLGKLHRHYDEAGLLTYASYDFKGNVRERERQVIANAAILEVFKQRTPKWQVRAFRVNWQPPQGTTPEAHVGELLDPSVYRTSLAYDALNRVKTKRYPQDVGQTRKELRPHYNRAGALESVELDNRTYVERIAYNAKGQRTLIAYANGVMTRYAYDRETSRLARLRTERYVKPDALTYRPTGAPLQDLAYEYDLVGNLLTLRDRAPGGGLPAASDALDRAFAYDPLYRLLSATGRECDTPPSVPWSVGPRCADITKARAYKETYQYDMAGNLRRLQHQVTGGSFTRVLALAPNSNRLAKVTIGSKSHAYTYAPDGTLVREGPSRHLEWDHAGRMRVYRTQVSDSEPTVHVHYLYDAGGNRVKKLVRKKGQVEVTVYIDGVFERHQILTTAAVREHDTLHVMDDQSRIAQVRVGQPFEDDKSPAVKYHLGDHLGSSHVVVDDAGSWVNREEYTPYGETSFGSFARKRYRFGGKESDEESGFYYHGARYYAPWLARWVSCDPLGMIDGINVYRYVKNRPTVAVDPTGTQGQHVDIGADPEVRAAAEKGINELADQGALTDKRAHAVPAQKPMSRKEARKKANAGAADYRKAAGMTGSEVQAGHTAAARHAPKSGIRPDDMNAPDTFQELHSRKGKGLDVDVTDQAGKTKTTTRHRAQEGLIDDAVERVEAANKGKLSPQGQLDAAAEVRWRTENVPLDQRNVKMLRDSASAVAGTSGKLARAAGHLKTAAKRAGAAIPVLGMVFGHASAAHAAASGDVRGAALDEFGNIPVAGDLVDAGRAGYSVGEAINEFIPPDVQDAIGGTINEIVNEGGWKEIFKHPFGIGM